MSHTGLIEINTGCSDISFKSCYSELYVDNKFVGYTPIQLFLPVGDHNYKIIKPGYFPQPSSVLMSGVANVQHGSKFSLDVFIINGTAIGGLSINSSPEGANIFIDGRKQEIITPAVISGIIEGEHHYKLTMSGYEDIEGEFTMRLGQSTSIYNALIQLQEFGTVYIHPTPVLYGRTIPYILEGATIYIDNIDTGKKIPSPITGLAKGIHTFRVTRPNIEDSEGMFVINGGDILLISIYPILLPKTGMLTIYIAPFVGDTKVARVNIDGKDTGEYTNVRFALSEGTHTYRLQIEGYEDVDGKFDIIQNRITQITPNLRHVGTPIVGRAHISSNPPGASVAIDGVYLGQYTPTTVRKLFEGDYTYRLSRSGYLDTIGTFTMTKDKTVDINPSLTQSDTILDISCNVIAAMVYIDNHTEGWTTPTEIIGLSPGNHTYHLVIPDTYGGGFTDANGTFNIKKNKRTTVDDTLSIIKEQNKGVLIVNSLPIGAKIFIDNVDTNSTSPGTTMNLSQGIHKIKLSLAGFKDWIGTVNIITGSIVSIFETLIPDNV
jgi:hypothetical protein